MKTTRSYSELRTLVTFEERFDYLRLDGRVGADTFGFDRYINQQFYRSREWRDVRSYVIVRDEGLDLGIPGREIHGSATIHHINPMTPDAIVHGDSSILDPDNLITVTHNTHNAIHYGDSSKLVRMPTERKRNDTMPWRR